MKEIILSYDETGYQNFIRKVEKARDTTQQFVDQVNEICKLNITDAELKDALFSSRSEVMAEAIRKAVLAELDKIGITSATVRKSAANGDLEKYYTLFNGFQRPDTEISEFLLIKDGKVEIDKEAVKYREGGFKWAIRTEAGKALYDAQLRMIEAMNDFLKLCPKVKSGIVREAFIIDDKTKRVAMPNPLPMQRIDYDRAAKPGV